MTLFRQCDHRTNIYIHIFKQSGHWKSEKSYLGHLFFFFLQVIENFLEITMATYDVHQRVKLRVFFLFQGKINYSSSEKNTGIVLMSEYLQAITWFGTYSPRLKELNQSASFLRGPIHTVCTDAADAQMQQLQYISFSVSVATGYIYIYMCVCVCVCVCVHIYICVCVCVCVYVCVHIYIYIYIYTTND